VLDGWAGTLLVVSHDRYLLERVTDRQVGLFGDGAVRDLPGGVDEYLRLLTLRRSSTPTSTRTAPAEDTPGSRGAAEVRTARKEMSRIERRLARLAEDEARLHAELADQASDHAAVLELDTSLRALVAERDDLELAWLTAAETAG
ncbi:MAG: ABC transporter ATP-binding protein, partial [Actinomycetota bacterium]|nr:ABC transporter ATP-binding protein [Actinomycetota bacterium]